MEGTTPTAATTDCTNCENCTCGEQAEPPTREELQDALEDQFLESIVVALATLTSIAVDAPNQESIAAAQAILTFGAAIGVD